jgi:hypothetical protein
MVQIHALQGIEQDDMIHQPYGSNSCPMSCRTRVHFVFNSLYQSSSEEKGWETNTRIQLKPIHFIWRKSLLVDPPSFAYGACCVDNYAATELVPIELIDVPT